ncbi:MAG: aldehyde dehydrogenase family protein [Methylibium sp.]|uniref:acylating sulfoacetaldehyde dehydrogenase n=1 Tax=Methylibium sp. TaxID=2067992 RepID=UPI001790E536|nr:aldehyde dehydrogenase family protein [Methylibium sp.]MBA3596168.1 aldehyde dehydrogenase family protein [Methylibium sp.]
MATVSYTARSASPDNAADPVAALVARAHAAQQVANGYDQARTDELVAAAGWAIMEPTRNRALAELAVADTGIGNVDDKIRKNYRKTLGLLRDLKDAPSVGVISEDRAKGLVEIARPVGVVAAITPSTNPAATPANKIINALKGRNAVIVAPSPKGVTACALLLEYIHAEFDRIGAPRDLVQMLPAPISKASTQALMQQCDLVVVTGSQSNVRNAYASGTPAFGVGAGNVASIVDETADCDAAAEKIVRSKTFDNATSCSSENSVVLVDAVYDRMLAALAACGAVLLDADQKAAVQKLMWPDGKLSSRAIGQSAQAIARGAGLDYLGEPSVLMVEEAGIGPAHPYSGEKLSPVLAVYRARDFDDAKQIVERIYAHQGAGHSVSLHSTRDERALDLGLNLAVARVIVNQAHCIATGGSFDNGLPFSLSMGCGTWGGNNFSDNMNYRHYLNTTRIARPIAEVVPTDDEVLGKFFEKYGR